MCNKSGKIIKERKVSYCFTCGSEINYLPSKVEGGERKYCSVQCSGIAKRGRNNLIDKECAVCKKPIKIRIDHLRENNFCSHTCLGVFKYVPDAKSKTAEYFKSYMKEYNQKNKERLNKQKAERHKLYYEDKLKAQAKYRKNNKHKITVLSRKRKQAFKDGDLSPEQWLEILEKYNYTCLCCKKKEPEISLTLDHIKPINKGGRHTYDNVQPLCKSCNSKKNTKTIDYRF